MSQPTAPARTPEGFIGAERAGIAAANDPVKLEQLQKEQPWIVELEIETIPAHHAAWTVSNPALSPSEQHLQNILSFLHLAWKHEDKGGRSIYFHFVPQSTTSHFLLDTEYGPVPEAELPVIPADFDSRTIPARLFSSVMASSSHHLIILPPVGVLYMNQCIKLMNDQVEYWTNEIFFAQSITPLPEDAHLQRLFMVRCWLQRTGMGRLYGFSKVMGGLPICAHLDRVEMFTFTLSEALQQITDDFTDNGFNVYKDGSPYSYDCYKLLKEKWTEGRGLEMFNHLTSLKSWMTYVTLYPSGEDAFDTT